MADFAELPASFLENIAWVNQPPPPQARDTHALHFFLISHGAPVGASGRPPAYQGFLFYRRGETPISPITAEQNGLDGTGFLFTDPSFQESWARVLVRFRTQPTARLSVVVILHRQDGPDGLPGTQERVVEFDEVDPSDDGKAILLDPGTSNHWDLNLSKTTVLL